MEHYVVVYENACVLSFEESEAKAKERVAFFQSDGYKARYDRVPGPLPIHVEAAARAYERMLAERSNNVVVLFPARREEHSGVTHLHAVAHTNDYEPPRAS